MWLPKRTNSSWTAAKTKSSTQSDPSSFCCEFALQAGGPSHATNRLLKGQLDDLRVYGSALTEADANAIFAGDLNSPFTSTTGAIGELGKTFSHAVTLSVDPKFLNVEGLPRRHQL